MPITFTTAVQHISANRGANLAGAWPKIRWKSYLRKALI